MESGPERILLIGGAGFVGSALAASLIRAGHQVTVVDSYRQFSDPFIADYTSAMNYRRTLLDGTRLLRGDARDALDMIAAFDDSRPQRVVQLAAVARAPLNEEHVNEAIQTATASATTTVQLAHRFGARRVLFVSSSYVYGDFQYTPCDEDHPTQPNTAYGAAKLAAEVITRSLCTSMSVPHTIARLVAVYGPWDLNGKLCAPNLAEAATTGLLPIAPARGDGGTDYTHIDDAVQGLRLALFADKAVGRTVNLARGRARTVHEVVQVLTRLGYDVQAQPERVVGRPRRGALSIERARTLLGYAPHIDLEDGLADCLHHATSGSGPARPVGRPS